MTSYACFPNLRKGWPVPAALWSKTHIVLCHSNTGIIDSNPIHAMDVYTYMLFFYVTLCLLRPCDGPIPHARSPTYYKS
jgi:hypothetical protein